MNILNKRNRGFTIIELLIVLAILGGIVAMLTRGMTGSSEAAKIKRAPIDINGRIRTEFVSNVIKNNGKMLDANEATNLAGKDPWGVAYDISIDGYKVSVKTSNEDCNKAINAPIAIDLSEFVTD